MSLLGFARVTSWIVFVSLLNAQDIQSGPTWTSTEGKSIQAEFVRATDDSVIVRMNGKEVSIPKSRLSPASIEQVKTFGATTATKAPPITPVAIVDGLKPLWVLPHTEISKADKPWNVEFRGFSKGGDLIYSAESRIEAGKANETVIALVNKMTGKLVWRTPLQVHKDSRELIAAHTVLQDDAILLCSNSLRRDPERKGYYGLLRIRKLNSQTGVVTSEIQMASDNAKSTEESGLVDLLNVSLVKITDKDHHAILTSQFLAEMDPSFTKVVNASVTPVPHFVFAFTSAGAVWCDGNKMLSGSKDMSGFVADWGGGPARELTASDVISSSVLEKPTEPPQVTTELSGQTLRIVGISGREPFQAITVAMAPTWESKRPSARMIGDDLCLLRFNDLTNKNESYQVLVSLPK